MITGWVVHMTEKQDQQDQTDVNGSDDRSVPAIPESATSAGIDFFKQHCLDLKFIASEDIAIKEFDQLVNIVAKVLLPQRDPREAFGPLFARVDRVKRRNKHIWNVRREVMLCRYVDSYLTYVSDLLSLIFKAKPEILKSAEQVTYEDVLQHKTLDDFIEWAADQRVNSLSYKGLSHIAEYFERRVGLDLFPDDNSRFLATRSVAIRNLIVHRRGIADFRFLRAVPNLGFEIGKSIELTHELAWEAAEVALTCARYIDGQAMAKFNLNSYSTDGNAWFDEP